jgi:tetratricopeptide (TPR) repeat protein
LVSDKSELACLSDSHAAQLIWEKEDVGRFRRFKPHAAPCPTFHIQTRWQTLIEIHSMGGGGGSIQGMYTSLKNNRMLLRTSHFYPRKKSFFNRKKEYIKAADGFVELEIATKDELLAIRKRILRKRRIDDFITLALFLMLSSVVVYFSFGFFKTNPNYVSPEEKHKIEINNEKYSFFISDGDTYLKKGQWHNAIFQYNKALEIFPKDYHANYRLVYASVYRCRNEKVNCDKASNSLQELIKLYPNKSELTELELVLEFVEP